MIQNFSTQQKLLKLCELTAMQEKTIFAKAVAKVMDDPANFELMTQAAGMRWKGKPLKANTVRNWIDPVRKQYIKDFPDITDDQRQQIAAFIPVRHRERRGLQKQRATELLAQGLTYSKVAEILGLSRHIVSGWKLQKSAPWQTEALKMHYNHISGRKIAQKLGIERNRVARFLRGKPRGPDPYAPPGQNHVSES
ncbi:MULTISPECIES: helix-turn-helix domain-containing protein [Marivita]|uniref:Uncharacterized protein n=1 Tax=Marivita cryptomonadis TaxID=505252 RepID=A0A9Q2RZ16_9RHOB|nr:MULTISPECIES: helix-turn-helix domain-containing protein [Marivita]MCR9168744.1 helix-turn-helix domain-containing protein [Paracoccaceae bacterium]MBM2321032.1 hypothetical protein [Marivita cryptomonadis]MBM2330613.1 hypothetical protein [Marivita cryptomonadis]MBM2340199.1 hypothetical protein [Marivita cryptomonadis]MBM2344861.1 hypothetical protein [Marivita cryptomonadis]